MANIVIPTEVTPQATNITMHHNLNVPDFEEDPITTEEDHDTIPTINNNFQWQPYHPENNFLYVHSITYHYMDQWNTAHSSKSHPFYPQFQSIKYAGLRALMKWNEVQKVLKIHSLQQYVDFVQMRLAVVDNLRLDIDKEYETIRFAWKTIMTDQDILTTVKEAHLSYQGLQHLAFNF